MARWGMPGPPQFGEQPALAGMARQAKSLRGPGDLVLRIRGYEAAQNADMVCSERGSAALRLRGPMDALAGVRGPKSAPVEGHHELFGFLTTEANAVVAPIHPKAMPVILQSAEEADRWLEADAPDALALQRPLPDNALRIVAK